MNFPPVIGGSLLNLDFVFYMVNGGKLLAMDMDVVSPVAPLLVGTVLQQQTPTGGFTDASLNGPMVMYFTCGLGGGGGLINADGIGGLTLTLDLGCVWGGGATDEPDTYAVAPNGRTDIRRRYGAYAAAYLVGTNQAFLITPDTSTSTSAPSGFGEPQAAGPFSNSSVQGTYVGYTVSPTSLYQTIFSGVFTADGASPTGTLTGVEDITAASGARLGVATTDQYSSISSEGRGIISGSFGANFPPDPYNFPGTVYVISPSKFFVISAGNISGSGPIVYPVLLMFEQ